MKRFLILAILLTVCSAAAKAEDAQSWADRWKKAAGNYLTMPSMPDLSILDLSKMGEEVMAQANAFTQQVNESLPILEQMGYEVSTIGVQWSFPPKVKVRLRSKAGINPANMPEIATTPNQSMLVKTLIWSAAEAKRMQRQMNLGTAIVDVDFAVPPKVKMFFLKQRNRVADITFEDLDLSCAQD